MGRAGRLLTGTRALDQQTRRVKGTSETCRLTQRRLLINTVIDSCIDYQPIHYLTKQCLKYRHAIIQKLLYSRPGMKAEVLAVRLKTLDRDRGVGGAFKTLDEGRGVGDGHRAVVRDRQQLVCRHGESISVAVVMERAYREVQEVQLPIGQTLPEHCGSKQKKT